MKRITLFILLMVVLGVQEVGAEKKESGTKAFYAERCKQQTGAALPFSCAIPGSSIACFTVHIPAPHKEEDHEPEDDEHEEDELAEVKEEDEETEDMDEDDEDKNKSSGL